MKYDTVAWMVLAPSSTNDSIRWRDRKACVGQSMQENRTSMLSMQGRLRRNHRTCTISRLHCVELRAQSPPRCGVRASAGSMAYDSCFISSHFRAKRLRAFIDGNAFKLASSNGDQIPIHEIAALQRQQVEPVYNRLVHRDAAPRQDPVLPFRMALKVDSFHPTRFLLLFFCRLPIGPSRDDLRPYRTAASPRAARPP